MEKISGEDRELELWGIRKKSGHFYKLKKWDELMRSGLFVGYFFLVIIDDCFFHTDPCVIFRAEFLHWIISPQN